MDTEPFARLFTVEEAQRTLPLVANIVRDILVAGSDLRAAVGAAEAASPGTAVTEAHAERDKYESQLQELLGELEEMGCYYKDWNFEIGLVDFPARIDEEVVFLCWRSDESTLGWYHRIEDGFAGRRRLPAEPTSN